MPRLYHKKSKTGCSRCRARRVKCDETKPICNHCHRHRVPCLYENVPQITSACPSEMGTTFDEPQKPLPDLLSDYRTESVPVTPDLDLLARETMYPSEFDDSTVFDIPESRSRRLLEIRLIQNFIAMSAVSFAACHHERVRRAWTVGIPKLAVQHDNLLYQILSMSALHLLRSELNNLEVVVARQTYQGLAMREHRKEVARLSWRNADAVCCASGLIFMDAFASLRDRTMDPYTPPMGWLNMARGAGSVFAIGVTALKDANKLENAQIKEIQNSEAYFDNGNLIFDESNRKGLLELLRRTPGEEWDDETQQAYEKTLSYIGWVQKGIEEGEHVLGIVRKMMAFAVLAPKRFVEVVEEMRPRALAILAHFFALGSRLDEVWWVGGSVRTEIQGIRIFLPDEWQPLIRGPVAAVGTVS